MSRLLPVICLVAIALIPWSAHAEFPIPQDPLWQPIVDEVYLQEV